MPQVGLLGGRPLALVGSERRADTDREAESRTARAWDALLFPGRTDVFAYWHFAWSPVDGPELSVTSTSVSDPPPADLRWCSVDSMDGVGTAVSEQLLWFSLGAIDNDDVRLLCGHVLESHRFFYEPTAPMQSVRLRTGAMGPHRITPSTSSISTGASRVGWDQVVREGLEAVEECRALLAAAIDSGDYPPDIT